MEKESVNYHLNGIFFEDFARKNWESYLNKSGLTLNEKTCLEFAKNLRKIKAEIISAIKSKENELKLAKAENLRLRIRAKELKEISRYKESSLFILQNIEKSQ